MAINQFYRPKPINQQLPFERLPFNELFAAAKYAREKEDQAGAAIAKLNDLKINKHGLRTRDVANAYNQKVDNVIDPLWQRLNAGERVSPREISKVASDLLNSELRQAVEFDIGLTESYMNQRQTENFDKGYQGYFDNKNQDYIQIDPNNVSVEQLANDARFVAYSPWSKNYREAGRAAFVDQYKLQNEDSQIIYDANNEIVDVKDKYGNSVEFSEEDVRDIMYNQGLGEQLYNSALNGREYRQRMFEENGGDYTQEQFTEDVITSMKGLFYKKETASSSRTGGTKTTKDQEEQATPGSLWSTNNYGVKQKEGAYALHEVMDFYKTFNQSEQDMMEGKGLVASTSNDIFNSMASNQNYNSDELGVLQASIVNQDFNIVYDPIDHQMVFSHPNVEQLAVQTYPNDANKQLAFMKKMRADIDKANVKVAEQNVQLGRDYSKYTSMSRHRNKLMQMTGKDTFEDASSVISAQLTPEQIKDYGLNYEKFSENEYNSNIFRGASAYTKQSYLEDDFGTDYDDYTKQAGYLREELDNIGSEAFLDKYANLLPDDIVESHRGKNVPRYLLNTVALFKSSSKKPVITERLLESHRNAVSRAADEAYGNNEMYRQYDGFLKELEAVHLMSTQSYILSELDIKEMGDAQATARGAISDLVEAQLMRDNGAYVAHAYSDDLLKPEEMKKIMEMITESRENGDNLFNNVPMSVRWDNGQKEFVIDVSLPGTSEGKIVSDDIIEVRMGDGSNLDVQLQKFGVQTESLSRTHQAVNNLIGENYNSWSTVNEGGMNEYSIIKHENNGKDASGAEYKTGEYEVSVGGQTIKTDNIQNVYTFHNNMHTVNAISELEIKDAISLVYGMGGSEIQPVMDSNRNLVFGDKLYIVPDPSGEFNLTNSPGNRAEATMADVQTYLLNQTLVEMGFDEGQRAIARRSLQMTSGQTTSVGSPTAIPTPSQVVSATTGINIPQQTPQQTPQQPTSQTISTTFVNQGMSITDNSGNQMNNYIDVAEEMGSPAAIKFKEAVSYEDNGVLKFKSYQLGAKGTGNKTTDASGNMVDTKDTEIDCSGTVCTIKNNEGAVYPLNMTNAAKFYTDYAEETNIQPDDWQDGDLIVMNTQGKGVDHIGIMIKGSDGKWYIGESTAAFKGSVIVPFEERINALGLSISTTDNVVENNAYEVIRDNQF